VAYQWYGTGMELPLNPVSGYTCSKFHTLPMCGVNPTLGLIQYLTKTKLLSCSFNVNRFWKDVFIMYDCIEGLSSFIIKS